MGRVGMGHQASREEKRGERRNSLGLDIGFVYEGRYLKAQYRDFSQGGMGLLIHDEISLREGEPIEFLVGNCRIRGLVIWIGTAQSPRHVGLKVVEDLWVRTPLAVSSTGTV